MPNIRLSLKDQLLIYFMLIAIIPAGITSLFHYYFSQQSLKRSIGESNYKIVANVLDNIDHKVQQVTQFTDMIYIDPQVVRFLERKPSQVTGLDRYKSQAIKSIDRLYQLLPVAPDILALILAGENGGDLRGGNEGFLVDYRKLTGAEWYRQGEQARGRVIWGRLTPNYAAVSAEKHVIPVVRVINDIGTGRKLGTIVLLLSPRFFKSCYNGINLDQGEELYLVNGAGDLIFAGRPGGIGPKRLPAGITGVSQSIFELKIAQVKKLAIRKRSANTGWQLLEILPMREIGRQRLIIANTALLLLGSTVFLCWWFSLFLSDNFTRPIKRLVGNVKEIAQGRFTQPVSFSHDNEINDLGQNIAKMARDLQGLLEESLRREQEKRDLETKMLQSQINPHFLHNTLNSIKWMAALQGADGIKEMANCLGRLLEAVMGEVNQKVTLAAELRILDDYLYIQRIRYKGKVNFKKVIPDATVLNYLIVKFTLQPLVENAIFHGIEPKDGTGEIIMTLLEEGSDLKIVIYDNGVGMTPEQLERLTVQEAKGADHERGFHHIGVQNIERRIKLIYGAAYGMHFESKLGEYTRVALVIPKEAPGQSQMEESASESLDR